MLKYLFIVASIVQIYAYWNHVKLFKDNKNNEYLVTCIADNYKNQPYDIKDQNITSILKHRGVRNMTYHF